MFLFIIASKKCAIPSHSSQIQCIYTVCTKQSCSNYQSVGIACVNAWFWKVASEVIVLVRYMLLSQVW